MKYSVALLAFVLPAWAAAQRSTSVDASLTVAPHAFVSRAGDTVLAEIGHFRVPESRRTRGARTITLAFVRFPSTSAHPGPPIVYLAGGPGGSGIALARGPRFPAFMAMRAAGDVIALDQRGTGLSVPNLACPQGVKHPLDVPLTRSVETARLRTAAQACATHWRAQGVDLSSYNTEESADDIDDLRRALGVEHVVLWGASYGTHLGLVTLRRHPQLAERAMFAGVEGPDDTFKLPSSSDRQLDTLAALAYTDSIPDARAALGRVLARLASTPARVRLSDSVTIVFGRYDFLNFVNGALGNGEGMAQVPAIIAAAARGDFTLPARYIAADRSATSIGSAMGYAMDCASGASRNRRRRIAFESRTSLFGTVANDPMFTECDVWGVRELGPAFRQPVHSSVPVLFISGTLDLNTPLANARAVARGVTNARALIIDGASHGDALFLASPAILRAMHDFLAGRATPPRVGPSTTAFVHATVIDGTGGPARAGMTVVIRDRHVVSVARDAEVTAPASARVVNARGKYLIPGLWDMHVHLAKAGAQSLALFVANGVTSVRDMGGDFAMIGALRDSVNADQRVGPRIKTPGPILEDAANVVRMLREGTVEPVARFRAPVATIADGDRTVDSIARLGVDFVKIRTVASPEVYAAIGRAVRRNGLTLVGHMVSTPDEILVANQRSIEHVILTRTLMASKSRRPRSLRNSHS